MKRLFLIVMITATTCCTITSCTVERNQYTFVEATYMGSFLRQRQTPGGYVSVPVYVYKIEGREIELDAPASNSTVVGDRVKIPMRR